MGSIVGRNHGTIINCTNHGTVRGSGSGNYTEVGGITGINTGDGAVVANCVNYGTVTGAGTATYGTCVGGIAGVAYEGTVANCVNHGAVTRTGTAYIGGIAGDQGWTGISSRIANCYWNASVTANASLPAVGYTYSGDHVVTHCVAFTAPAPGTLKSSVTAGGTSTTSLLTALNAWVSSPSVAAPSG